MWWIASVSSELRWFCPQENIRTQIPTLKLLLDVHERETAQRDQYLSKRRSSTVLILARSSSQLSLVQIPLQHMVSCERLLLLMSGVHDENASGKAFYLFFSSPGSVSSIRVEASAKSKISKREEPC